MKKVKITTEHIELSQLLKLLNFISTGGEAKYYLSENTVLINGEEENRRGRKIYPKDIVQIEGEEFLIQ
ncbi:MAG: S4 domain-containing protein YaaA [Gammaproteobacteria bacterium]|nr:S4 domain-containing protein YaaA [Gammaproteobacteria bacterium]